MRLTLGHRVSVTARSEEFCTGLYFHSSTWSILRIISASEAALKQKAQKTLHLCALALPLLSRGQVFALLVEKNCLSVALGWGAIGSGRQFGAATEMGARKGGPRSIFPVESNCLLPRLYIGVDFPVTTPHRHRSQTPP